MKKKKNPLVKEDYSTHDKERFPSSVKGKIINNNIYYH